MYPYKVLAYEVMIIHGYGCLILKDIFIFKGSTLQLRYPNQKFGGKMILSRFVKSQLLACYYYMHKNNVWCASGVLY